MKHFKLVGPETTREFDIEDDEMITSTIIKMSDYEKEVPENLRYTFEEQNVKIYPTKEQN